MTPIFQTIIDPVKGNCMQAAYASILEISLGKVPNFTAEPDTSKGNSDTRVRDFLKERGLSKLRFNLMRYITTQVGTSLKIPDEEPIEDKQEMTVVQPDEDMTRAVMHAIQFSAVEHFLLSVPSQKYDCGHIVVGKLGKEHYRFEVAHDPNEGNEPYDLEKTRPTAITIITTLL